MCMHTVRKFLFNFSICFLSVNLSLAQYRLVFNGDPVSVKYKKEFGDSVLLKREIARVINEFQKDGFIAASADFLVKDSNIYSVYLHKGNRYRWARIAGGNIDERVLNETGNSEKKWRGSKVSPPKLAQMFRSLLQWYEDNGYPFAEVRLDSLIFEGEQISGVLRANKSELVRVDSIIIRGDSKLSRTYLFNYLRISQGNIYNESIIRNISVRLKELPMVSEYAPLIVAFEGGGAVLTLFLNNKKASQADGIIGVLPDATKSGKVNISGELRLKLLSAFGRGEQFEINWKQPLPKTQDLKTSLSYPFLFSLPFGLEGGLNIYKRDTSYVDVLLKGGIQYLMKGNDRLTLVVTNKKSSLLSTSSYRNATVLPTFADVNITTYGVVLKKEKVDYRLNPQRGFIVDLSGAAGVKKILKNSNINSELYKGLKLNSDIYKFEGTADFYQSLFPRIVLNAGFAFAWMQADDVFQNDQFRFGGLKSLRGFDEDVLYATSYYLGKLELRYLLDRNAYLQLFYNQAYYASETRDGNIYDIPYGMGAGITFETKLGIFALNYAIGSQQNSVIQFRQAKVHFGIVNYF